MVERKDIKPTTDLREQIGILLREEGRKLTIEQLEGRRRLPRENTSGKRAIVNL